MLIENNNFFKVRFCEKGMVKLSLDEEIREIDEELKKEKKNLKDLEKKKSEYKSLLKQKFKIGDWIKSDPELKEHEKRNEKYINLVYEDHLKFYNKPNVKRYFVKVEGDEIKLAEEYFEAIKNIKVGDYLELTNWNGRVIEKIIYVPSKPSEYVKSIDKYCGLNEVRTSGGYTPRLAKCPDMKVSSEVAKDFFEKKLTEFQGEINKYKELLKDFD